MSQRAQTVRRVTEGTARGHRKRLRRKTLLWQVKTGRKMRPYWRLQRFVQPAVEGALGTAPLSAIDHLSMFKIIIVGMLRIPKRALVPGFRLGIYFDETDFTAALFCDILEDWCKSYGRAATVVPKSRSPLEDRPSTVCPAFAGRINDFSVKQLMTAASTFCRVLKPIVGDAVNGLTMGTNGVHS